VAARATVARAIRKARAHMRKTLRRGLLLLLAAGVLAVPAVAAGNVPGGRPGSGDDAADARRAGRGLQVVGLTDDGRLVRFAADAPGRTRTIGRVSGLSGDRRLIGIDHRVQDGKLYGVGNAGGIYTLSTADATASKVSQLTVALVGNAFGVDFNPAANRLRVVSDAGQNLRHNLDDAAATTLPLAGMSQADGTLTIPPATTPAVGVSGAAYTNNDLDPGTATTLFDIDTTNDQVQVQSPANAGALSPAGKLRVDAGSSVGFDIYSRVGFGTTQGNRGLATVSVLGRASLFQVNLLTGKLRRLGGFRADAQVVDLAVPLGQGSTAPPAGETVPRRA
jgi:hypothetical protein